MVRRNDCRGPRFPRANAAENSRGEAEKTPTAPAVSEAAVAPEPKETREMLNRRFTLLTFAAVALATFIAPASASAQSIWDRIRDRTEQEQQRQRDEDWRRNRRDDDRYGRNGRISDYERRQLRDLARR